MRKDDWDDWQPLWLVRASSVGFATLALAIVLVSLVVRLAGGAAIIRPPAPRTAEAAAFAPASGQPTRPGQPAVRSFTLVAQEVDWELLAGTTVRAWTYNGQLPGPELRVTEGDLVRVTLINQLPVPTAIHWHGVNVPNAMDGVPGLTQEAVPPGGTFTYEFTATNPGTRWYHSHQDPEVQVALGLYGALIIEPRTPPPDAPAFDREYTYLLSEWALALTPAVATGAAALPTSGPGAPHSKEPDFDLFLMNGKAGDAVPSIDVKPGQRVLVRLINAGSLVHVMHLHGHSFRIVATDGNPVPPAAQLTKDSVTLGPSERLDLLFVADNPGIWLFHCHIEHHMANGMMALVRYEGATAPVGHLASPPPPAATTASTTAEGTSGTGSALVAAGAVPGSASKVVAFDNRFQPGQLVVPMGTTVAWVNTGANVHTVSAFDGSFESGAIAPGQAFLYTFQQRGTFSFLCRQHFLNGMSGQVTVQ